MELRRKLAILADAAKYDASCASSGSFRKRPAGGIGNTEGMGICHSYTPDGRCVSLLKILLTNYCIYDCTYCINRASSSVERARFTPEEVAALTLEFYRRNFIEGLFLSSGIIQSADYTMEQLARVARLLREDHLFGGYIHLKAIPGASPELLEEAGRYADRLSANLELPNQKSLDRFAPGKREGIIEGTMASIDRSAMENAAVKRPFAPSGQTTQLIVGATADSDRQLLLRASGLYARYRLRRVYYSAFSPIPDSSTALPAKPAPLRREHRLYEADWLCRQYGFSVDEVVPDTAPELDLTLDPKSAWAIRNRAFFPVDVNKAFRGELLRVPGFGLRSVQRILDARRFGKLRMMDLARLKIPLRRAVYFIVTADSNPYVRRLDSTLLASSLKPKAEQLSLFDSHSAVSGQL